MSPKSNQVVITLVSFLTYFVLSSMLAPIGILSGPMAEHFGQSITDVTKQFSWLTGGILVGAVIALFIFDWTSLRKLFITIYGLVALVLLSLVTVDSLESGPIYIGVRWSRQRHRAGGSRNYHFAFVQRRSTGLYACHH